MGFFGKLPAQPSNGGMQNGSSVRMCTRCIHVFLHVRCRRVMLSRCLSTKFLHSELSQKFIKSVLLVGYVCVWERERGCQLRIWVSRRRRRIRKWSLLVWVPGNWGGGRQKYNDTECCWDLPDFPTLFVVKIFFWPLMLYEKVETFLHPWAVWKVREREGMEVHTLLFWQFTSLLMFACSCRHNNHARLHYFYNPNQYWYH